MRNRYAHHEVGSGRRKLFDLAAILCAVGLACILIAAAVFSFHYYSAMESELRSRTESAAELWNKQESQIIEGDKQEYPVAVKSFKNASNLQVQILDAQGNVIAASDETYVGYVVETVDVSEATANKVPAKYIGKSPTTGERIIAISEPVVNGNGELSVIIRCVSSTVRMDMQIVQIIAISCLALVIVLGVVLISGHYYIRSILVQLDDIIDKAKKITNGSYGIQIQTQYCEEVGELAETVNEMSNQLNQNEKIQTEFISSLSHELRTPLTAITGWSETLLSSEDLSEDTRRGMKIIHKEAGRLTEMVLELLEFTRIQDGRMTLHMECVDIRAEFEDTIFMYGSRLAQDGIKLEYLDDEVEIPEISCDPQRLRQVFLNILDNAAKHGSEGKRIEASITYADDMVTVTIRDFGQGIPEDELPLVKKKFYKGSSKARGSGIGLAVCDEIVELHGGIMTLSNAPGGGTLVTVQLPISQ